MNNFKETYSQQINNQPLLYQRGILFCFFLCTHLVGFSQIGFQPIASDSTRPGSVPTLNLTSDSTISADSSYAIDSLGSDSFRFSIDQHKSSVDQQIEYQADDSIVLQIQEKKAYLYGNAQIIYGDITLNADYIVIDFDNKDLYATGITDDSTQTYSGRPAFEDDGKIYEADTMLYNFETKKGISYGVLTTEKDGYIHGERVLRDSLENIYVKNARFTTCNLPDPHFYIQADKIKVIPKKQIVTGPANLVISDIKTPLFVPFGFFPIPEKRKHGILFPTFGESQERGFNLRGLGYYVPVNDYFDVQLTADIYFRGGFAASLRSNYYRRYKYRGNFNFSFNRNEFGEPESPSFKVSDDYRLGWTFSRDSKAKPGRSFSANVNFVTSSFLKNNTTNYEDIISTNSNSSINYSRGFFKRKLNMSLVSRMDQNLTTGAMNMTLPQLTANLSRQMPFKNFSSPDNKTLQSFIKNLGVSYQGTFKNELKTVDTVLVAGVGELFGRTPQINAPSLGDDFRNGVSHSIPISTSFKAIKWFTVSPSFSFNEFWYFNTTEKTYDTNLDTVLEDNRIGGFERAYSYRTSIGISTILYGQKNFRKESKLQAIRHVVRPNISAVWNPDFASGEENGYRTVATSDSTETSYSIFEDALLGRPTAGPQASLNFGLGNNLEIKIKSDKDTTNGGIKKVKIIESLNVGSGYNFLADSFHLADFRLSANTTILNKIRMTFSTTYDPYTYIYTSDSTQRRTPDYAINGMNKLGNFTSSNLSISTNLNPQAFKKKTTDNVNDEELEFINNNLQNYVDFNLPWSLNLNYNLRATTPALLESTISQNIGFSGDLKLTENWKIGVSSGYNITDKELAFTSLEFFRDLHCWQMHFKWYPIQRQMFEFGINVKSSTLQDLKLNRRRSWFDY